MENANEGTFPIWKFYNSDFKITNLYFKTNKVVKFILGKQRSDYGFGNIERTFWALFALKYLNKLNITIDPERIESFVSRYQAPIGGFFNIIKQPDMWTTFYAIFTLRLINSDLIDEIKSLTVRFIKSTMNQDGLFSHCKNPDCICGGQASLKSTFFALLTLSLLDSLDVVENHIRNPRYLLKKISKQKIDNIYLLLCRKLLNFDIDDGWTSVLLKFQRNDGGFGQKEFGTMFETFWMLSFLQGNNWLHKVNMGRLFDFLKHSYKKDGGFNDKLIGVPSDLITTAQATASLIMLTPELIDFIENELLKQVHFQKEVYLKSINEEYFINERLIFNVVKNMVARYDWFDVDLIKFRNVFNTYIKSLNEEDQRIAKKLMNQIRNKKIDTIDINTFAKSFRKIKNKEEKVKEVISNLIKNRFIIGSIEYTRKLLKKSLTLKVYFVPDDLIIRKKDFPFEEIIVEKEEFKLENERVKQITQNAQQIPSEFSTSILTLLDTGEVELAREKLNKNFTNQTKILETLNREIKDIVQKFRYMDFSNQISVKIWNKKEKEILKNLNNLLTKLDIDIRDKEKIIKIYEDLEELVNNINDNLLKFDGMIEKVIEDFNDSCLKEKIDVEQAKYINKVDEIEEHIQSIATEVKQKATVIAGSSKSMAALKNIRISEEKGLSKKIITQLSDTLEPFDYFLENQWNRKRESSKERLLDIKSKIHSRNVLLREIKNRKEEIYQRIDGLTQELDEDELDIKIGKLLEEISDVGRYIENYVLDTNILIDGFANIVALDVPKKWSEDVGFIHLKLNEKRREIKKMILSMREEESKEILETKIENFIVNLKSMLNDLEKLETINYSTSVKNLEELIKEKKDEFSSKIRSNTDEIKKYIKNNVKDFKKFDKTTNISVNRWQSFIQGLETIQFQKKEKITETVLISLIDKLSTPENGGRVDISQLAKYIGLKKNKIKYKIEKLMLYSKIEMVFDEKEENIIPLKADNKKQLEYEEYIDKYVNNTEKEHLVNFFQKVCEKKLLNDNATEIYLKIDRLNKKIEENDSFLERDYSNQIVNPYNNNIRQKWEVRKEDVRIELNQILVILNARQQFGLMIGDSIDLIEKEINNINQFILAQIRNRVNLNEDLNLKLDLNVKNYKNLLEEQKSKQAAFIKNQESNFPSFNRIVTDLRDTFNKKIKKLELKFLKNKEKLEEIIKQFQTEILKDQLKIDINKKKEDFQKLLEKFDQTRSYLERGQLDDAYVVLKSNYNGVSNDLRKLNTDISNFIKISEKKHNLINFKDACKGILRGWDMNEMEDLLERIMLGLENQIILKHIEFAEKAYSTPKIKLNLIASKLNMKTNKLKERLYQILGSANINVKISPYKNEIVFTDRQISEIKQIEAEQTVGNKLRSEYKEVRTLWDSFVQIFKFMGPILTALVALISLGVTIAPFVGVPLAITIPVVIFILIVIGVFIFNKKFGKVIDLD